MRRQREPEVVLEAGLRRGGRRGEGEVAEQRRDGQVDLGLGERLARAPPHPQAVRDYLRPPEHITFMTKLTRVCYTHIFHEFRRNAYNDGVSHLS